MTSRSSIAGISVSFVLGVAAGEAFKAYAGYGTADTGYAALAAPCLALILLLWLRRRNPAPAALVFAAMFFCGVFTSAAGGLRVHSPAGLLSGAARRLAMLIDSIPFKGESTSAVLKAFLLGDRSALPRETAALFRSAGASHLLALSGLHIGILYSLLSGVLRVAGRSRGARIARFALTVGAGAFYTVMTGAGPSIVRAFLFILLREGLLLSGRKAPLSGILQAALMIQLTLTPWVIHSVGFQLSYLAVGGIAVLHPSLSEVFPSGTPLKRIWDASMLTLSCQAFTAPLVWYRFGSLPGLFLICNLVAIPLTTAVIFASLVTITIAAAGFDPTAAIFVTDTLVSTLLGALSAVSG